MDCKAICSGVLYAEERARADILITTGNRVWDDISTQGLKTSSLSSVRTVAYRSYVKHEGLAKVQRIVCLQDPKTHLLVSSQDCKYINETDILSGWRQLACGVRAIIGGKETTASKVVSKK